MGQPKLLLPLNGNTVIRCLLDVLDRPEITETIVVVRPDDDALRDELAGSKAICLQPDHAPPDMRDSVACALSDLHRRYAPAPTDAWMLIPADHPLLDAKPLDSLLYRWSRGNCRILIPTYRGRRGHPTIFAWDLAEEVPAIPANQGINWLLRRHSHEITELPLESKSIITDLDTPEDYAKFLS
jgi:molybdenum cofactor cytidylyltransferase